LKYEDCFAGLFAHFVNAIDVDDGGAMRPNKSLAIQTLLK